LYTVGFHVRVAMFARFGYARTASPERYSVRSANLLASRPGMSWVAASCTKSGSSLPAIVVANFWG